MSCGTRNKLMNIPISVDFRCLNSRHSVGDADWVATLLFARATYQHPSHFSPFNDSRVSLDARTEPATPAEGMPILFLRRPLSIYEQRPTLLLLLAKLRIRP